MAMAVLPVPGVPARRMARPAIFPANTRRVTSHTVQSITEIAQLSASVSIVRPGVRRLAHHPDRGGHGVTTNTVTSLQLTLARLHGADITRQ